MHFFAFCLHTGDGRTRTVRKVKPCASSATLRNNGNNDIIIVIIETFVREASKQVSKYLGIISCRVKKKTNNFTTPTRYVVHLRTLLLLLSLCIIIRFVRVIKKKKKKNFEDKNNSVFRIRIEWFIFLFLAVGHTRRVTKKKKFSPLR